MRYISPGDAPNSFKEWVRDMPANKNQNDWFQELHKPGGDRLRKESIICDLHQYLAENQLYLCAYCCCSILGSKDTITEHVEPRSLKPARSLDYTNMVASCSTKGQCDSSHGSRALPLTPFMRECESDLVFYISGRVKGKTDEANEVISILNLGDTEQNNRALIEKRKNLFQALMFCSGFNFEHDVEDEDLLEAFLSDVTEVKNGRLEPFSPALANMLRNFLGLPK